MNLGSCPTTSCSASQLPESLAGSEWLGDFYGGVPHSVREIYVGELGWFDGDPTTLAPLHPRESSARYIELMGGRDSVLAEAEKAADGQ